FQAEDGIRDDLVTGVQTCALPILQIGSPDTIKVFAISCGHSALPGATHARTFTLRSAGANTALACTMNDPAKVCRKTLAEGSHITVSAGTLIDIGYTVTSTPAAGSGSCVIYYYIDDFTDV